MIEHRASLMQVVQMQADRATMRAGLKFQGSRINNKLIM